MRTANRLGCRIEELVGMKVDCPQSKLGQVIGKKGKKLQQLSSKTNVSVDIDKSNETDSKICIVGPMESLDAALSDLDRVISETETSIAVSEELVQYLTTKGITAFDEMRQSHPHVRIELKRLQTVVKVRGIPMDIESFQHDLDAAAALVTTRTLSVTSKESGLIVGKQGAVIENLVMSHQTAINVSRQGNEESTIKITGPSGHVEAAAREIEEMREANKEAEHAVPVEAHIKATLLLESGKGIKSLSQKVNEAINDKTAGLVNINFASTGDSIIAKGKQRVLDLAVEVVQAQVRSLEAHTVRFKVDPAVIPIFIGKGGQNIKKLKGDHPVTIEFDRVNGEVLLCSLDESKLKIVEEEARALGEQNHVERISVDPAQYGPVIKEFFRTQSKEVNRLAVTKGDDENNQIVLRGSQENLEIATGLVRDFLTKNFFEEMDVTKDDIQALLSGGKTCKLSELATETGVSLHAPRERQVVAARGEKSKVLHALKMVRSFLYGGEDISVVKITVDEDVIGSVLGKNGKHRTELENRYESVSIVVGRVDNVMTIRGVQPEVEACRLDVLTLMASAKVTQKVVTTEETAKKIEKTRFHRRLMQTIPVQITLQDAAFSIRGLKDDVRDAVSILEEQCGKEYQTGYYLDDGMFKRLQEVWRDPSGLKRIEHSSGAKLSMDEKSCAVVFSGKRSSVERAKLDTLKFFEFLFSSQFTRLTVTNQILVSLGKSGCIPQVTATCCARLIIDRDLKSILVFAENQDAVEKSRAALQAAVEHESKLVSVLQLEENEDWIVSLLLGKNGAQIKSLRKQTACRLDMDSRARRLTISAEDENKVARGREMVDEIVEKARKECVFVSIPNEHMAAFVGRSGAHIKEFSEKHMVEVQVMKKGKPAVRLTGTENAVQQAKEAVGAFISDRQGRLQEEQALLSFRLKRDQLPVVIGPKGSCIRGLEREFGCKIDVDKGTSIVTVRGRKRVEAVEKIKQIALSDPEEQKIESSGNIKKSASVEAAHPAKPAPAKTKPVPELATEKVGSFEEQDFPSLSSASKTSAEVTSGSVDNSWASLLQNKAAENLPSDEETTPVIESNNEDHMDATFLGDVDETGMKSGL